MGKVILISGKKRSGKDCTGELIKNFIPKTKIFRFADPIKEIIAKTFNISLEELEEYKNNTDQFGLEIKAYPNNQPDSTIKHINFREILQRFGTEAMKPIFGERVWVEATAKKLEGEEISIITDFRFKEEYNLLNKQYEVYTIKIYNNNLEDTDSHASETELDEANFKYDFYIDNTDQPDITNDIKDILNIILTD
jgi:hypothetical protein